MKKTFVNPEMNISLFDMENVLTLSNNSEANEGLANANVNAANITTISAAELVF